MPLVTCTPYYNRAAVDPGYNNVSLLLRFNEADGSNLIVDSSSLNNQVIPSPQFRTVSNPSKFDNVGFFNGSSGYIDVGINPGRLGPADFTIEAWLNPSSPASSFPTLFSNYATWFGGNGGIAIFMGHASANRSKFQVALNGSFPAIQSTTSIALNVWQHIAVVRYGTRITLYVDGIANGYFDVPVEQSFDGVGNKSYVGLSADEGSGFYSGYMDEFRISKGLARYTENFIPPTEPFPT